LRKFLTSILATHGKFIQAKKLHKKRKRKHRTLFLRVRTGFDAFNSHYSSMISAVENQTVNFNVSDLLKS
jgi:hypothetical protein